MAYQDAKWCSYGKHWQLISEFHKSGNGYQNRCKGCQHSYRQEYKISHPEHYEALERKHCDAQNATRARTVAWLRDIKEGTPCTDCGLWYPHYVMDFDHLPQFTKDIGISVAVALRWSREKIEAEIAKCEVVCANCHRIRTHERSASLAEVGVI